MGVTISVKRRLNFRHSVRKPGALLALIFDRKPDLLQECCAHLSSSNVANPAPCSGWWNNLILPYTMSFVPTTQFDVGKVLILVVSAKWAPSVRLPPNS